MGRLRRSRNTKCGLSRKGAAKSKVLDVLPPVDTLFPFLRFQPEFELISSSDCSDLNLLSKDSEEDWFSFPIYSQSEWVWLGEDGFDDAPPWVPITGHGELASDLMNNTMKDPVCCSSRPGKDSENRKKVIPGASNPIEFDYSQPLDLSIKACSSIKACPEKGTEKRDTQKKVLKACLSIEDSPSIKDCLSIKACPEKGTEKRDTQAKVIKACLSIKDCPSIKACPDKGTEKRDTQEKVISVTFPSTPKEYFPLQELGRLGRNVFSTETRDHRKKKVRFADDQEFEESKSSTGRDFVQQTKRKAEPDRYEESRKKSKEPDDKVKSSLVSTRSHQDPSRIQENSAQKRVPSKDRSKELPMEESSKTTSVECIAFDNIADIIAFASKNEHKTTLNKNNKEPTVTARSSSVQAQPLPDQKNPISLPIRSPVKDIGREHSTMENLITPKPAGSASTHIDVADVPSIAFELSKNESKSSASSDNKEPTVTARRSTRRYWQGQILPEQKNRTSSPLRSPVKDIGREDSTMKNLLVTTKPASSVSTHIDVADVPSIEFELSKNESKSSASSDNKEPVTTRSSSKSSGLSVQKNRIKSSSPLRSPVKDIGQDSTNNIVITLKSSGSGNYHIHSETSKSCYASSNAEDKEYGGNLPEVKSEVIEMEPRRSKRIQLRQRRGKQNNLTEPLWMETGWWA